MHVTEQLSDYLDGLLPSDEREAVRVHLDECAECRADYTELQSTQKLLQLMPAMAAPRSFTLTPEMAGTARKASFWERFFVPQNAPRLATGSVVSFLLLFFFLASNVTPGLRPLVPSESNSSAPVAINSGAAQATDTPPFSASVAAEPTSTTAAVAPSAGGAANQSERAPSPENTPVLTPNTEVGTGGTSGITTTTSDVAPAPPSSDGTISNDQFAKSATPPADFRASTPTSTDNRTGWVALQLGLLIVGLALGAAAFIAWRRT